MSEHEVISACRSCGGLALEPVIDLGMMPLSDGLVLPDSDPETEPRYPLTVVFCPACSLVQIRETVPPGVLYSDTYPYYSSFSDALVEHARVNVEAIVDRYRLGDEALVVELASNDGYLLQWFVKAGISVLGIDPSPGPAAAAEDRGVPTVCDFFDLDLADRLAGEGRLADVVVGNNVLAHVPDQNVFVAAIARILKPDGVVVMEFPYVKDLVDEGQFDTIYHEHHCYFSVTSTARLFAPHGLRLRRVEHHPIHGGSLRVHLSRSGTPEPSVAEALDAEQRAGLTSIDYYRAFAARAADIRSRLVGLVDHLTSGGSRLAAYGAAAKGAIMLNYCGIGPDRLDYVVDRNFHKHGHLMPGVRIPIVGVDRLREAPPDYLLILPWNFKDEIMAQQAGYAAAGGRFIVPIPEPAIL